MAARELKLSEALFRGVSESAPVGVFRSDANGNVVYVNAKSTDIFAMTEQELLSNGYFARIHPDDREAYETLFTEQRKEKYWEYEIRLLLTDGSIRWIQGRTSALYDANGEFAGRVGTVDDITQRRQAFQYLQEAKEAAELANRTKDLFLANISHELRTPLNGVLGIAGQLIETNLSPEQFEMAQLIYESGGALLKVVNDMLDLSRIEAVGCRLSERGSDCARAFSRR